MKFLVLGMTNTGDLFPFTTKEFDTLAEADNYASTLTRKYRIFIAVEYSEAVEHA